ncbi:cytochrome b/b6 domain-containing protein [Xylophilus ampelinus]|uniref:Cytochrome b n=1 Tax=Xylophilus ampelinus TaxID=54067 RepID=A0A318SPV7_9BURK|nr:cytochrome b/b6 domain-containing protein [Xylophilus ampelinus]MCS4511645.1 cytochrome b/b6 domain-containing protein [Xylophilus ampelinus]PYE73831.1 cytochrome b [Xylophilus ampelinus]
MQHTIRVWDLPTRLFHWALAAAVVGLVVTGRTGGNAMVWHFRFGYAVLALLLFRLVWGFVGGRWSRFVSFVPSPAAVGRYLRGQGGGGAGHSPLGALSVVGMLAVLAAQVGTGLMSDDEIAFAGPLSRHVSGSIVGQVTGYHKHWGQWLVIGLVALHVAAILFYVLVRRQTLVRPMLHGDRALPAELQASRDDRRHRLGALAVMAACSGAVAWMVQAAGG